ncbi:MAG TPA: Maf family protein [Anaerolineaceae bacterium]|nr:septum formation protein Maf [Chloroflexota bacterium]HNZ00626.1 Maf family protein [Anaerolineaceae bacterium]HOD43786.1 Maf family protein [Anaerolineaceae bacterium]HOH19932.1 Maf family protein [Anaerolineaceae bacterium]HPA33376.1 Maf family protein [Anaerolineaceae bacterium]
MFCVRITRMAAFSLLLASNSPRRRELLGWTGWQFTTAPADLDERPLPGESPLAHVERLAQGKAHKAGLTAPQDVLVVGADTIVVDDGNILGKPAHAADAARMLEQLRGRTHTVHTALAVFRPADGALLADRCDANVPMRSYTTAEVEAYIATGDPLDKAGAYAIQHAGFHPVTGFRGCFACVMGFPLCHLVRTLRKWNVHPPVDVPQVCQAGLQYDCPVFAQILA